MVYVFQKLKKVCKNPKILILNLFENSFISRMFSDKVFLKIKYRLTINKKLNLNNPQTFNEKLQWLKLYDRKPEYTMMVDKYAVREYIAEKIGSEYLIPLLGVWDNPDDINFDNLPDKFVLKCNHNSGLGMCICKDKSKLDINKVKRELKKGLKQDYYLTGREWPYKNVKRKIIAEKYMVDESGIELKDYKFFCFDGEVKFLFVATERNRQDTDVKFDFFDMNFNHLPFKQGHENAVKSINCPRGFNEMVRLAEILSKGFRHLRVDFYDVNGKVYFGELTFFQFSGFTKFEPDSWDYEFGKMINLDKT